MRWLRFDDLKRRNIVRNRKTLNNWIALGIFPGGHELGPNTVAWQEKSIDAWEETRPKAQHAKAGT